MSRERMRECICCQCSEGFGQFKGWVQCLDCNLWGSEDEYSDDEHGEICNECWLDRLTAKQDKLSDEGSGK